MRHGALLLGGFVALLGGCILGYPYNGPEGETASAGSGGDGGTGGSVGTGGTGGSGGTTSSSSGAMCTPTTGGSVGELTAASASFRAANGTVTPNMHTVNAVASDSDGTFAIAGFAKSPLTIKNTVVIPTPAPSEEAFVAIFNSEGNVLTSSAFNTWLGESPRAALGLAMVPVVQEAPKELIVTGYTTLPITTGGPTSKQAFVHKLKLSTGATPTLTETWHNILGGNGDDAAVATAVDSLGNVYVTGYVAGNAKVPMCPNMVESTYVVPPNLTWGFVIKYDVKGDCTWSKVFQAGSNASGSSKPSAIAVDTKKVVITGQFSGTVMWGANDSAMAPNPSIFVLTLDNMTGAFKWETTFAGTVLPSADAMNSTVTGTAIALGPLGNIYVTGGFAGTVDFDTVDPNNNENEATNLGVDAFTAALTPDGTLQWVTPFQAGGMTTGNVRIGNAIAAPGSNSVYVTGTFDTAIQPGKLSSSLITSGGTNLFLAKLSTTDGSVQLFDHFGACGLPTDMVHMSAVNNALTIAGGWSSNLDFRDPAKMGGLPGTTGNRDLFFAHYKMLP